MCKRFFILLAVVLLVGIVTSASAATLIDVAGTPYETAFTFLSSRGVVQGYQDGSGRPSQYLNRAEALKVITLSNKELAASVSEFQASMPPLPLFADMRQSQWYAPYVEAAFASEIVKGYPDGTFRGGRLLTVEEAVTLLMRSTGDVPQATKAQLSDRIANISNAWFTPYINTAISRNIVMEQSILRLGFPITRGQFFDMVYRQMAINEQNIASFNEQNVPSTPVAQAPTTTQTTQPVGTTITLPQPVVSRVNNPNASEKYFAISMPSLGIKDLAVNHPQDPFSSKGVLEVLSRGVGHLFSFPGGGGKIMIYGHSSGYPWDVSEYTKIFRRVNELSPGDKIYVTHEGKLYTYEVTFEQTIDAKDTSAFNDNGSGEELILYTCWPPDSIAQRYLVHAKKIDAVALQ